MAPSDYQRQLRLREDPRADRGRTPISEAAAVAGFADQNHLSRWFVHYCGVTPAAASAPPTTGCAG
jgi:AraC-like DNA-binding protein